MKLKSAEVNWMLGWANKAHLEVTVDTMPKFSDMRFERKGNLYWAEKDGYVQFFAHDPTNETGFGGRSYDLILKDGSDVSIKGPWSSRSGAMNKHFPHSVDVTLTDEEGHRYGAHITLALAQEAAKLAGVELELVEWHDDLNYEIKDHDRLKEQAEWRKANNADAPDDNMTNPEANR